MITKGIIHQVENATVRDRNGVSVGVVQVFPSDEDGSAAYVCVAAGLLGRHQALVLVDDGTDVHVGYTKDAIKGAPSLGTGRTLSLAEANAVRNHFGLFPPARRPVTCVTHTRTSIRLGPVLRARTTPRTQGRRGRTEPAFTVFHDEVQDWGVAALERATEGLRAETAVHICYGYGIEANNKWKETLGAEWRQYEQSFPLLQQSSIDIVSLECIHSHVPLELVELIRGKKVILGAIDVATEVVETPEEVAEVLRRALEFVDADKLIPSSNCGMAPLARGAALDKLGALSAGADIVRAELVSTAVPAAR